ncbi:MAG: transposase [Proteobacteria bacterium]|nr:transposase [Pseudomonadota bacterium]
METNSSVKLTAIDSSAPEPGGSQGARRATGEAPGSGGTRTSSIVAPDPEVAEKRSRRRFTAKYKLRILQQADNCNQPGQLGALLRREGLYSSNLTAWRRQREKGMLTGLAPKKRGRKNKPKNPLAEKIARLEKENRKLRLKLKQAETIIDVQKKISQMLEATQDLNDEKD